jgi:hypothetical protein
MRAANTHVGERTCLHSDCIYDAKIQVFSTHTAALNMFPHLYRSGVGRRGRLVEGGVHKRELSMATVGMVQHLLEHGIV